jgi:hypothetical protein
MAGGAQWRPVAPLVLVQDHKGCRFPFGQCPVHAVVRAVGLFTFAAGVVGGPPAGVRDGEVQVRVKPRPHRRVKCGAEVALRNAFQLALLSKH